MAQNSDCSDEAVIEYKPHSSAVFVYSYLNINRECKIWEIYSGAYG